MSTLSVVIADDHEIIRNAVRETLEASRMPYRFNILAEATNGIDAIVAVKQTLPDLLILDLAMPLATGAEVIGDVCRRSPATRILVLTGIVAPGLLANVVDSGAHGIFSKISATDLLIEKLPIIMQGAKYVAPELVAAIETGQAMTSLTEREQQTLNMMVRGLSNREMAEGLHLSPKTVEKHRGSLMRKLGVHSTAELLSVALKNGMIDSNQI